VLDRTAIENYFPDKAVPKALGKEYVGLGPFDKLKEATVPWHKSENWKIARQLSKNDLKGTDLGKFLDSL
jgi:hypothetical protein